MLSKRDSVTCPPPSEILLYLSAYLVFSCFAALLLGSQSVRRRLRFQKGCFQFRYGRLFSICGSLLIQIGATVATGYILENSLGGPGQTSSEADLSTAVLLWFARPLATFLVTWLSIMDRPEYSDNSREVGIVDTIYGLVNLYIYGLWAHLTDGRSGETLTLPKRLLRAGSALGLLSFILNIVCVALAWDIEKRWQPEAQEDGNNEQSEKRMVVRGPPLWVTLFLHGLRFVANWLLWAGVLLAKGSSFCIGGNGMLKITSIWLFIPFVDALWRGFATHKEQEVEYSLCTETDEP